MNRLFKCTSLATLTIATLFSFNACNKPNDDITTDEKNKKEIVTQYVNHTIIPTYKNLAQQAESLVEKLKAIKTTPTDANVNSACETFLETRAWWEKSEAFLFGPAKDFGIDPHIDSWPLDLDALQLALSNTLQIEAMAGEEGDIFAGENLGNALLGFHGIEYILFNNGSPRNISEISDLNLTYAIAVAGDLRNRCYQLEVSWAGKDNVEESHFNKVEELEMNYTVNGSDNSYGDNMLNAGNPGSTYPSLTSAMMAIVDGCKVIADEVGTSKIGKPHFGEDINYIESPYSQKSIEDFYDNIISIKNAYMGGIEGQRDETKSIHAYIKKLDEGLDAEATNAIENALEKIHGMAAPFVNNISDASAAEAIKACTELDEVLSRVNNTIRTNI